LKGTGIANDSKRLSIACPASSEVFDPRRAIDRGSRRHRIRRPHALSYLRDDQHRRPARCAASLAFHRLPPRPCRLGRRSRFTRNHCVVTAASSRVRLRLGVRRPRPPCFAESIGLAKHYGHTLHDRPGLVFMARSGASLEVSRPLQHTSAASRAYSEGGRPPDLSRSGV